MRKPYYWLMRTCVSACGLILILVVCSSPFFLPELYYDTGPIPPLSDQLFSIILGLGCAAVLLLPHTWTIRGWLYYVKLVLLIISSIVITFFSLVMIITFFEGGKSWVIIPVSLGLLMLAFSAPATLLMRKRQVEAENQGREPNSLCS